MLPSSEECIKNIYSANARIKDTVLQTPLLKADWLCEETGSNVFLKLETEQITGSFKLRGATNKICKLYETDKEKVLNENIVTASSGNHALACAHVAEKLNIKLSIYSYLTMAKAKEEKLLKLPNVELTKYGKDCCEAEMFARTYANDNKLHYSSPYNDLDGIYGQASIGLELLEQCKDLDAILVPVGGGGLISGIALCIKLLKPKVKIIGCQPVNDCCMYECVKAGHIVDDNVMEDTFADGTSGRVEPGSITFEICQKYVDDWILLEESEIERAVFDMLDKSKKLVEGSAGLVVAAARKLDNSFSKKNIALIISGANVGVEKMKYVLNKYC